MKSMENICKFFRFSFCRKRFKGLGMDLKILSRKSSQRQLLKTYGQKINLDLSRESIEKKDIGNSI
ncbi:CLUMA_CG005687, isoform A [Clunio marinus]|uniref:CLUMA_CG005687, isoform A n=1 Tax=Clunio marinus TaxID=568069 RepID=A0A1J1HVV6_9DIPT|nr:CLUMA_CG005687, isoform A [Clunio marinus]